MWCPSTLCECFLFLKDLLALLVPWKGIGRYKIRLRLPKTHLLSFFFQRWNNHSVFHKCWNVAMWMILTSTFMCVLWREEARRRTSEVIQWKIGGHLTQQAWPSSQLETVNQPVDHWIVSLPRGLSTFKSRCTINKSNLAKELRVSKCNRIKYTNVSKASAVGKLKWIQFVHNCFCLFHC